MSLDAVKPALDAAQPGSAAGGRTGLRKTLGLLDVIAQSISVIAPAMSGAFLTYLASTKAGGATPLAYLLGTLAMLCVGMVVAQFATRVSSAGSLYTYITQGLSRGAGFVAGWCYAAAFLILGGAVMAGFGFFTSSLVASVLGLAEPVSWFWFFAFGLVVCALLSMFDVNLSTRSQLLFAVLTIGGMLVVSFVVISIGSPETSVLDGVTKIDNPGTSWDAGAFSPSAAGVSWTGIFFGLSFAMLSYTGAEACAVLAEETRDPRRNIPRAVIGSILLGGAIYLVITYATSIGFGVQQATQDWPASVAGLAAVAPSTALGNVVLAAAAAASFFCALGVHTAVSRVLFAMGRERVLPGWFGQLHPRFRTPWHSILFTLVVWFGMVMGSVWSTSRQTQVGVSGVDDPTTGGVYAFSWLATLGTPLVMFVYLLVGVAGIVYGVRTRQKGFVIFGVPATAAGGIAVFGGLYYSFVEAEPGVPIPFVMQIVPWACLALVIAAVAVGAWLKRARPRTWQNMGAIFDEE